MVKNLYHKSKIQPATLERTSHAKLEELYFLGKQSFINCDFFFFFFFFFPKPQETKKKFKL